MAYFLATNVLSTTPPEKTPCLVSSGSQIITFPTIDGNQPYIIDTKLRWQSNSPAVYDTYLMGNGHDTDNGGGWYLRVSAGGAGNSWINVRDAHDGKMGKDPYYDYWYNNVLCGPKRTKFYDLNDTYSSITGNVKDYPMALFGISQFPNKLASIALARTKVSLEDVTVMDLVPVNEFAKTYFLLNNAEFTYSGQKIYLNSNISSVSAIRDTVCMEVSYIDSDNVVHKSPNYTILKSHFDGGGWGVTVNSTFDDGKTMSSTLENSRVILGNLPSGATKVVISVYITGSTKEGCFYDTVNNKYYFSETSTPLVYSEL